MLLWLSAILGSLSPSEVADDILRVSVIRVLWENSAACSGENLEDSERPKLRVIRGNSIPEWSSRNLGKVCGCLGCSEGWMFSLGSPCFLCCFSIELDNVCGQGEIFQRLG